MVLVLLKAEPPPAPGIEASAEPIDTPSLRYVSAQATVIFAARPSRVPDLRARLFAAGLPADALAPLDALGLKLENAAEVAGGLVVRPDTLIPRAVVAVTLQNPIDTEALRTQLKAAPAGPADTYQIAVRNFPVYYRECPDRVLVFATELADLTPALNPGGHHLPADVRATVDRVPPDSVAWLATGVQDWASVPAVELGQKFLDRTGPNRLKGVTAAWAALPPDGAAVVRRRNAAGEWE